MSTTASAIEWTDATWNPVVGCKMVSPGCANCYAETMSNRLAGMALADDVKLGAKPTRKDHYLKVIDFERGRFNGKVQLVPEALADPLGWRKPRRVFVNSMSDLFHEGVPFEYVAKVYAVCLLAQWHTFQILTKRPERAVEFRRWLEIASGGDPYDYLVDLSRTMFDRDTILRACNRARVESTWPIPNVWLGTSVEDQKRKTRIDALRCTVPALRFLSLEPLLEDLETLDLAGIGWVIVGGESGHGARPCNVAWVRSIVEQCKAAGVACFVKQLGGNVEWDGCQGGYGDGVPDVWPHGTQREDIGGGFRVWLNDKKGGDMAEWTSDLRVREMPQLQESSR
jgi:protein gp37